MEFNFKKDINKTIEMIEKSKVGEEITDFYYSKAYSYSTINHKDLYPKMGGNFSSFLGITGSMSPAFNIINLGGKDITCFDISLPSFCYAYFQIASVLALTYQEYIHFVFDHANYRSFDFEIYKKIREYLPNINPMDVRKYFDTLYDYIGEEDFRKHYFKEIDTYWKVNLPFWSFLITEQERNNFLSEELFNSLKNKLKSIKFNNIWADIRNIPELLNGNTYDKIILSCANHFIYNPNSLDVTTMYDYMELLDKFKFLLKNDGQLQGALIYILKGRNPSMYEQDEICEYNIRGYQEIVCDKDVFLDVAYVYKKS